MYSAKSSQCCCQVDLQNKVLLLLLLLLLLLFLLLLSLLVFRHSLIYAEKQKGSRIFIRRRQTINVLYINKQIYTPLPVENLSHGKFGEPPPKQSQLRQSRAIQLTNVIPTVGGSLTEFCLSSLSKFGALPPRKASCNRHSI